MARINSKDKRRVNSVRKRVHIENNSTTKDKVHAQCQICDRKEKMEDRNIEDFFEVAHGKASFKSFMEIALPEFKVPSDDKARRMIINIYTQSTRQLTELLQDTYSVTPPNDQDKGYYAELLYGELDITASQSSSTNVHSDNEIVDLAGRVDQALSISHGRVQKHKNTPVNC
ncbi:1840_t:CDS:2 [Gigaspora rosea]|nr:1840_t:CDS:2 [Gigaspora rosea]